MEETIESGFNEGSDKLKRISQLWRDVEFFSMKPLDYDKPLRLGD